MIKANEKFDINYIDSSGICSFTRCPAKYMLSRLSGLSKPSNMMMAADYGTDMHEALPYCYNDGSAEKAIEIFTTRWNARNHDFNDKRNIDCAINTIYDFYNSHKNCPYKIVQFPDIATPTHLNISKNELPFIIDIGGPLPLAGRIDAPVRWKTDNTLWALDYKAAPLNSIIMAINGPKFMGDIQVGDKIIGLDGKPCSVMGVYPQGIKDVYEVELSDGSTTECTWEHLWTLEYYSGDNKNNLKTKTVSLGKMKANNWIDNRRYWLPAIEPVQFNFQDIPIEPYALGALLGDGYLGPSGVNICGADEEILHLVHKNYPEGNWTLRKADNLNYLYLNQTSIPLSLEKLGLKNKHSKDKFIPMSYLCNSEHVRLEVLRGLMDTDGSVTPAGSPVFITTSSDLATGVKFLVESLGGICKIRVDESLLNGKFYGVKFACTIMMYDFQKVFRLQRKIDKCRNTHTERPQRRIISITKLEKKECQCIMISNENGIYLTDNFIPTHNTSGEVSQRFFNGFENSPQALAYTIALSQLTEERARGFIVEAIRVSKKNAESQMHMVFIKDCQIEHFIRFANNVAEQILECNEKQEWPMNCAACGTYSMFHIPGYSCDFLDICTNPDKSSAMRFYDKTPPWHPFAIGDDTTKNQAGSKE